MPALTTQDLRGRVVLSLGQEAQVGIIQDVVVDPVTNRVPGLQVRTPRTQGVALLPSDHVLRIRADSVVIADGLFLQTATAPALVGLTCGSDLGHTRVVSYTGIPLGMLRDVEFDPAGFHIIRYLLSSSRWGDRTHGRSFPPVPGLRVGADVLVVPDHIVAVLQAPALPTDRPPAYMEYADSGDPTSGNKPLW